jgi:hypothetical protein
MALAVHMLTTADHQALLACHACRAQLAFK